MAKTDLGRTIIDELRLCYTADSILLDDLSKLKNREWKDFGDFSLFRTVSRHFKYGFDVLYNLHPTGRKKVATLRFGHHSEQEQSFYVYYRLENEVLYDHLTFDITMKFPELLGITFKHITSIDLARDYRFDVVKRIRKIARDEAVKVIVNYKTIDKSKDMSEGMFIFPLNFKKLSNPTISIKQVKAVKDKSKGLTLCAYNKSREIEIKSHKDYIKEFYGNPKSLYRLEVHQNNVEIKDFCEKNGIVQDASLITDQQFLDAMYDAHLSSLLRFTKGRTKLNWRDILQ